MTEFSNWKLYEGASEGSGRSEKVWLQNPITGDNGRDYLYLIWKAEKTRKQHVIGELSKNGQYEFKYCETNLDEAMKEGFKLLVSFPDKEETYTSDMLFSVFSSRLPDRKRKNIEEILKKYAMDKFEPYTLLKRSGARLPIDSLEFIDPILDSRGFIKRFFYMAGTQYYVGCEGENCSEALKMEPGQEVHLQREPENGKDQYAVAVYTEKEDKIGYIPRYYSEIVSEMLLDQRNVHCEVESVNKEKGCHECIELVLTVED